MKTQTIEVRQYIFDSQEMKTIFKALQYAKHRIIKHPTCGARAMSLVDIEKILNVFDFEFSYNE